MAKYCEACKQSYADNLAACPKCGAPAKKPDAPLPHTPKKGAGASPMLARQPQQPAASPVSAEGKATMIANQGTGQPTMIAGSGQAAQPTMIAGKGQAAQPTMIAKTGAQPTMIAKTGAQPTMIAKGAAQQTQLAPAETQPFDVAGEARAAGKPTMVARQAAPTMLAKGAAQKTQLAPADTQPLDVPAESAAPPSLKATKLFKGAQPTQLAKTGHATTLAPPGQNKPLAVPPGTPKGTIIAQGTASPTMLAKSSTPTSLAPTEEEPMELPEQPAKLGPKATMLPKMPLPTRLAPPEEEPMELPTAAKATMLPKVPLPTRLAPAEEEPMELPKAAKATMLPKMPLPTRLAPAEEEPMELPGEGKQALPTMLARAPQPTALAPADEQPMDLPGGDVKDKHTMLAQMQSATVLGAPEEQPLSLPAGAPDKATILAKQGGPTILVPEEHMAADAGADLSAREMLESGGEVEMGNGSAAIDASSTKYDTAPAAAAGPRVKPKYGRRWLGGTILGTMIGSAAVIALALFDVGGLKAPRAWKEALGLPTGDEVKPAGEQPAVLARYHLVRGDYQKAIDATEDSSDPELTAIRGEARWLLYVQVQDKAGKPLNRKDAPVEQAVKELTQGKAKEPLALYWIAHVEEKFKNFDAARKMYEEGKRAYPAEEKRYSAALDRLDDMPAKPAGKEGAQAPGLPRDAAEVRAEMLTLVLTALLQAEKGPKGGKAEAASSEEAGYEFWRARRAARNNDYQQAIEAIKKAQQLHEKRRFINLRKQQNPASDPTEEIFLRACNDLIVYYQMRNLLHKEKYLANNNNDPLKALDAVLASRKEPNAALKELLAAAKKELDLKETATYKDLIAAIVKLAKMQKDMAAVKEDLTKGKYVTDEQPDLVKGVKSALKDAENKAVVQKIGDRLVKAGVKEDDTDKGVGIIITERDDANKTLDDIVKRLEANNYLPPKSTRKDLLAGLARAIDAARSPLVSALGRTAAALSKLSGDTAWTGAPIFNFTGKLTAAQAHILRLRLMLTQVRTPREMIDFWLPLVERRQPRKDVLDAAALDARRVLQDQGASPEVHAGAHTVTGLVLRNQGQHDDARASLSEALKAKRPAKPGQWRAYANRASRELKDPVYYYLPEADRLMKMGDLKEALEMCNEGVAAFPKDGRLLAMKSLVELDTAIAMTRGVKRLQAKAPLVDQALKDAEAAIAAGSVAEGHYAAGRVAEETGDNKSAEDHYRAALKAHPINDAAASRYRVALGRILLQFGAPRAPADKPNKIGKLDAPTLERQVRLAVQKNDGAALFTLLTVAAIQPEDDLDENPDYDEAIRLGDEAIKAGNPEGYLIKGLALARKKMWTKALETYTEGLRRLIRPQYAEGLFYIVDNHPAFKLPDALRNPDPVVAEKHYALGLRHYFLGRYPEAETELKEAYRNNGQDARYLYYLGLSRLAQRGKRDQAVVSFQLGSLLERQNKPSPQAINASLERVQGRNRQTLESYRR